MTSYNRFSFLCYRTITRSIQFLGPIDLNTPKDAQTRIYFDDKECQLVFPDEFNQDSRSFYPGDNPFWEAT
jgi:hypothetical protein